MSATRLSEINALVVDCKRCARLVSWREQVAQTKRASFADEDYWGRPVPGFGDPNARVLILGLAPAAHGANRTGRIFTGDRSGDWLFSSLHRCGFANQPTSSHIGDGLALIGAYITAAVRCAPPANKPLPEERRQCQPWLSEELRELKCVEVIVALGAIAWDTVLTLTTARPKPRFGHGAQVRVDGAALGLPSNSVALIGSYHPSQQNTFTGRLTEDMIDSVFHRAAELAS